MRHILLEVALTHDLRSGDFSSATLSATDLHPKGKELIKKMIRKRRLFPVNPARGTDPGSAVDWVQEAVESHCSSPVSGIVTCATAKQVFRDNDMVVDVANCTAARWWAQVLVRQSWNTQRTVAGYAQLLRPLLQHANSLVIIDPHFDPSVDRYQVLDRLLRPLSGREEQPKVELHRICYEGSGRNRTILNNSDIERRFRGLSDSLRAVGVSVEVFVWGEDHNRYLLTDIGNFQLGNGLDVSADAAAQDTWSRIDGITADDIHRRHDPGVMTSNLRHRFVIGTGEM